MARSVRHGSRYVLHSSASDWSIIGVLLFFFSSVILSHREHHRTSHFPPLLFSWIIFYLLSCLVILYRKKHVDDIFDMIRLGQNWAFLHRGLRFSGYLVYPRTLPFLYCKGYRSIVWRYFSYLIFIDKQP